jgi:hypothetical protein
MTFTLVSHLREQLAELARSRAEKERRLAAEKERLEIEVGLLLSSREGRLPTPFALRPRKRRPGVHLLLSSPSSFGKSNSIRRCRLKE